MRIIVFSDSHRDIFYMKEAVKKEHPDVIIHLGDLWEDAVTLGHVFQKLPLLHVRGNCDAQNVGEEVLITEYDGVKIMLTHGHQYHVKRDYLALEYAARETGVDVVLFGHTHCVFCEKYDHLWIMNPGACRGNDATYGVVEIENGRALCYNCKVIKNIREEV